MRTPPSDRDRGAFELCPARLEVAAELRVVFFGDAAAPRAVLPPPPRVALAARPAVADAPLLLRAPAARAPARVVAPLRLGAPFAVREAAAAERPFAGLRAVDVLAAALRPLAAVGRAADFAPERLPADAGRATLAEGFLAALARTGAFAPLLLPVDAAFALPRFLLSVSAALDFALLPAFLVVLAVAIVLSSALYQVDCRLDGGLDRSKRPLRGAAPVLLAPARAR